MASEAIIEQISQAIRQSGYAPDFGSNEMARALMPTLEEAVRAPLLAEIERLREAMRDAITEIETGAPLTGSDILSAALVGDSHDQ